jgi:Sulfotransferase domain
MTLRAIGAGFGRTGTDSMREALNVLGFGPCHHMHEIHEHDQQKQIWRAMVHGAAPDWEKLFEGYNSCVDWPSAYYWRELIVAYPEAKVILTYRSAESWWASFEKTILVSLNKAADPQSVGLALIPDKVFDGKMNDKAYAMACYEANVNAVRETVPASRLLVHELGDGWEPLCAHLEVPVPDVAYPSSNNAEVFRVRHLQSPNAGNLT